MLSARPLFSHTGHYVYTPASIKKIEGHWRNRSGLSRASCTHTHRGLAPQTKRVARGSLVPRAARWPVTQIGDEEGGSTDSVRAREQARGRLRDPAAAASGWRELRPHAVRDREPVDRSTHHAETRDHGPALMTSVTPPERSVLMADEERMPEAQHTMTGLPSALMPATWPSSVCSGMLREEGKWPLANSPTVRTSMTSAPRAMNSWICLLLAKPMVCKVVGVVVAGRWLTDDGGRCTPWLVADGSREFERMRAQRRRARSERRGP
jgi:hypothetical protein